MENYSMRITKKKMDVKVNAGGFTVASFFNMRKLYDVATDDLKGIKEYLEEKTSKIDQNKWLHENRNITAYHYR